MKQLAILLLIITSPALAQESTYAPPDQELWGQMVTAFGNISMPLSAHQQVQQILQTVQQQAALRARQKAPEKTKDEPPK